MARRQNLVLLAACLSVTCVKKTVNHCEDNPGWDPACSNGERDADTDSDGGAVDSGLDSGPCHGQCPQNLCVAGACVECISGGHCEELTDTPVCDERQGKCVACVPDGKGGQGCPDGQHCLDGGEPACVECLGHQDCPKSAPRCDAEHTCRPCDGDNTGCDDGVCFRDLKTAGDNDADRRGTCVECNTNDDCQDRGASSSCDPWGHICVVPQETGQCLSCVVDEDCPEDQDGEVEFACVELRYPVESADPLHVVGTYCLPRCPVGPDDCLDATMAGGFACKERPDRHGVIGSYCVPASTTCEAYLAHNHDCSDDSGCSHDGRDGDLDGICLSAHCTYPCRERDDCPGWYECVEKVEYCGVD